MGLTSTGDLKVISYEYVELFIYYGWILLSDLLFLIPNGFVWCLFAVEDMLILPPD